MRIIQRGTIPKKTKVFVCPYCRTVFEADSGEYSASDQIAYIQDGITAEAKCPVCQKMAYSEA